jgi:signal transduction histidine kinase
VPAASVQAASARTAHIVATVLLEPIAPRTWRAVASLVISAVTGAVFFAALTVLVMLSGAVCWIVGLGTLSWSGTLRLSAAMADADRWRLSRLAQTRVDPVPLPQPALDLPFWQRQRTWAQSPTARRLLAYQFLRFPLAAASLLVVALVVAEMVAGLTDNRSAQLLAHGHGTLPAGIIAVFVWPLVVRLSGTLEANLARAMLGPSRGQLSAEVQRLGQARTLAIEAAEAERRRIERDLHDGLQPKLVSLALELGIARARFERDPGSARSLLEQAHEEAKIAIEDLRGLVRGIHPSVLDERGLDAALSALVAGCPVPVRAEVSLAARPDQTREAAAYFVVAEAITNLTKHAGASAATVAITGTGESLRVLVEDNGRGGARIEPDGGLAGLAARVRALDGTFTVTSPPGGPTQVEAVIPCAR